MFLKINEEMKQRLIKLCCRKNGRLCGNKETKTYIKQKDFELYEYLCNIVDLSEYDDNIKEVIFCIIHDIEYRPICPVCGKYPRKFNFRKYKYSLFCSVECEEKSKRDGTYSSFCDHTKPSSHKPKIQRYVWDGTIEGLKTFFKSKRIIRYDLFDYEKMKLYQPNILQYFMDNYNIDENTPKEIINEVIYCFMNDINWNERPICPVCEEHIRKFNGYTYGAFCSKECQYSDKGKEITLQKTINTTRERYGVDNVMELQEYIDKINETTYKHFGVKWSMQNKNVRELSERRMEELYGVKNAMQSDEIKKRQQQSLYNNYGVYNPSQSDDINKKKEETLMKNYGVTNPMHSNEIKQRLWETNEQKYNVPCVLSNDDVRKKCQETLFNNYGVYIPWSSDVIRKKSQETLFNNYGVKNAMQSDEIKQRVQETNMRLYGVKWHIRSDKVQEKINETIIRRYGSFEEYYKTIQKHIQDNYKHNKQFFGMSKIEVQTYKYLTSLFGKDDIIYNEIVDERYPFNVDFYIKSIDMFIEINAHQSHNKHLFDENDENDIKELDRLLKLAEDNKKIDIFVDVWTRRDPTKVQTAKDNNLLYLPIWSNKIKVVIEEIEKFFKEHNIELPEPTYEYTEEELFPNLNKKEESE